MTTFEKFENNPHPTLLIIDKEGRIVFHAGLENQESFLKDTIKKDRFALDLCKRRIFSFECGNVSYIGVATQLPNNSYALLISESQHLDELTSFIYSVDFSFDILNQMIQSPFDGMTVVDSDAKIVYLSPVHEKFFGLSPGEANGRHVTQIIENTRLHKVVQSGTAEIAQIQNMQGTTRIVSRIPILRNGRIKGAVGRVMFKGPDKLMEMSKELNKLKGEVEFYRRENLSLRNNTYCLDHIIGNSEVIRRLKQKIEKVSELDVPVLITGESGTGKELIAQSIHQLSSRRDNAMIMVNAAALPDNLVESELFGYEPGAFTGAQRQGREGKFEAANDSTLFLDEIGDMPLNVQVKLLRVLQNGVFERIGGNKQRHTNFRLITATNRPLQSMIESEEFRLDLFYRISGIILHAPPLRERLEDIPELVESFFVKYSYHHNTSAKKIDPNVFDYLKSQPWPGNIRQLSHEIERALIFCDGPILKVDDFDPIIISHSYSDDVNPPQKQEASSSQTHPNSLESTEKSLKDILESVEASAIIESFNAKNGNKKKVAETLGISRSYLYKRLKELGVE